jgi:membrane fusion protein, multidrug efflux system
MSARAYLGMAVLAAAMSAGCRGQEVPAAAAAGAGAPVAVTATAATQQPMTRFIAVSGTLAAQEEAEVAAEIAGRVVATPIERGSRVGRGAMLIQIADTEVAAQAREAEANAAQLEARLGMASGAPFEVERVPEVANARAAQVLARTEFDRTKMLQAQQLVSKSEFDQKQAQADAAQRQYEVARNGAEQQYQALMAARARVQLARKALADTQVRAPFEGVVGERLVSVGDYVTRGAKIASVMRISPLRLELTVPAQYLKTVSTDRAVHLDVDAYAGEAFTGIVRFVSPALKSDSRSLMIEALVPNEDGRLKPGLFATARIEQAEQTPAILIPKAAVTTNGEVSRVFVVKGDLAEERLITVGQPVGENIEATSGIAAGDRVIVGGRERLRDGVAITVGAVAAKPVAKAES